MRYQMLIPGVLALSVAVAGCSSDDAEEILEDIGIPEASLYVYNQMTDDVTADVHAGDGLFERLVADDLPYSDQTRDALEEKINLTDDTAVSTNIRVVRSDTNTFSNTVSLTDERHYTVVVMGDLAQSAPVTHAYERVASVPAPTNVRIRLIHAGWNLTNTTWNTQNSMVSPEAIQYGNVSEYREVTPVGGAVQFVIVDGITYNTSCNVTAGGTYDAILAYPNNTDPASPPANVSVFCHQI